MTETTASAVNHDANLLLAVDSHLASGRFVENLLHHLHGSYASVARNQSPWPGFWVRPEDNDGAMGELLRAAVRHIMPARHP